MLMLDRRGFQRQQVSLVANIDLVLTQLSLTVSNIVVGVVRVTVGVRCTVNPVD